MYLVQVLSMPNIVVLHMATKKVLFFKRSLFVYLFVYAFLSQNILSRLLHLAFSANMDLFCTAHPGMGRSVSRLFRHTAERVAFGRSYVRLEA